MAMFRTVASWPICQADFRDLGFLRLPAARFLILLAAAGPGLLPSSWSTRRSTDMWVLFVKLFSPVPWWLEPKAHKVRHRVRRVIK